MTPRLFIRLSCGILDNAKVRRLPETTQLMYVWCLLLHKEGRLVGKSVAEIAYSVRLPEGEVARRLGTLQSGDRPLLGPDLAPRGWDKWQTALSSSTERVRAYRSRRNAGGVPVETPGNGETLHGFEAKQGNTILEKSTEEKSREEGNVSPTPDQTPASEGHSEIMEILRGVQAIGPEWQGMTDIQFYPIWQAYPNADWCEVVKALTMDYGRGAALPRTSTPTKELRKYASNSEMRWEKSASARKQPAPPWQKPADTDFEAARDKAARLAAEREQQRAQEGGGR